jgi:excisionase family DNA binding protein
MGYKMLQQDIGPKLTLTTLEVVALTGISRDMVQNLVKGGILPNVTGTEKRIRIPRIALEKYLEAGGQK